MPLTGEAKRRWQRAYMREVRRTARAAGQLVSAAVQRVKQRSEGRPARPEDTARTALGIVLENQGLTVDRVVRKIGEKLESRRRQTIAGKAVLADDNDAQLRACDQALRLHGLAGTIPSERTGGTSVGSLTINVLSVDAIRALCEGRNAGEPPKADRQPEALADPEGDAGPA